MKGRQQGQGFALDGLIVVKTTPQAEKRFVGFQQSVGRQRAHGADDLWPDNLYLTMQICETGGDLVGFRNPVFGGQALDGKFRLKVTSR